MLFTKTQIQNLINEEKDLKFFREYMEFEDIGQGYGYKSWEAWNFDNPDVIVYIPEYCDITSNNSKGIEFTTLDISSCYTKQDFLDITEDLEKAEDLFESVDWQHPTTLWNEWDEE